MIEILDKQNKIAIEKAYNDGRINDEVRDYLKTIYDDSIGNFRELFVVMGKLLGAPKAAVLPYNSQTCKIIDESIKISDINPKSAYMVHHRLDADVMRNQFFEITDDNKTNLSVSSIVSVIVAAQKLIDRALDKVTGKYYNAYVDEIIATVKRIFADNNISELSDEITQKIRIIFSEKFITNASETVLYAANKLPDIVAVQLVRAIDKITKPHRRLNDVWRIKCLFDLVPQSRTFIERIKESIPDKIIKIKDSFFDLHHPRNYRDIKIILNIGTTDKVIPMEIICQTRIFFENDLATHSGYKETRKKPGSNSENIELGLSQLNEQGVRKYNTMICNCLDDLFDRVGWNILYSGLGKVSLFDGFPKISKQYYSENILDAVFDKIDNAVENEIFSYKDAPTELTQAQEMEIFHWMTKFILVSAVPYKIPGFRVPGDTMAVKLFNFVMNDLDRHLTK